MTSKESDLNMPSPPSEAAGASAMESEPGTSAKGRRYKQRPLGPAPFASFEDLSDGLDSPPESSRIPLPGIKEDPASQIQSPISPHAFGMSTSLEREEQSPREGLSATLGTPAPPRIDISRASSSSQHEDSVTSSPEREGGNQTLGYKEDGTVDLRSSTEELDYTQEPGTVEESEARRKREKRMKKQQQLKQDFCETQSEVDYRERKSSTCSVMSRTGLLCISGRTSRLSSVGSIASEASIASGASHLSTGSQASGRSTRSPSPLKMLLETSFCGTQPVSTQRIEAEAAPSLVSHMEKQASRPPSRFSSRSPSPRSMILETSFCGSKQFQSHEAKSEATAVKTRKKRSDSTPKLDGDSRTKETEKPIIKADPDTSGRGVRPRKTEARGEEAAGGAKPRMAKPVSLPRIPDKKVNYSKPKKVISIRDIPGDEIYIPLKGPEVDFEEIIRKASPNPPRRRVEQTSEDVIFIPLHSPEESEKDKENETERENTGTDGFQNKFDDFTHKPLNSSHISSRTADMKTSSSQNYTESTGNEIPEKSKPKAKSEDVRRTKYEVCEDGSIIIPLHSPDEESRPDRSFEEQIKRVDEELQKAREIAEKKSHEEEAQNKPVRLDLSEYANRQSLPASRPDLTPVGSRTPSPGSTLSRKSSFASIFRRSDVTGSPDSSGGSIVSRKSGTLSNILKEAGEGLRDRSRSRSKNRDRQSPSSMVRSPSIKKNVFTNLFGKKTGDEKASCSKTQEKNSNKVDQQSSHATEMTNRRSSTDEGDYIIIPLRDPSDPPPELEHEVQAQSVPEQENKPLSSIVVLEKFDSSESSSHTKKTEDSTEDRKKDESITSARRRSDVEEQKSQSKMSPMTETHHKTAEQFKQETEYVKPIVNESRRMTENKTKIQEKFALSDRAEALGGGVEEHEYRTEVPQRKPRPKSEEIKRNGSEEHDTQSMKSDSKEKDIDLQHDSSLEMEEGPVREEMMAVTTGGVRKLKLPPEPGDLVDDHERKGLVLQESFEDELPYVPTTLPLERSVGLPILPVKQRVTDIKTCPIDRPRSTTPINPLTLEEYVNVKEPVRVTTEEKMKISLPREDSLPGKGKSPRRFSAKGKSWFEFAEEVSQSPREQRKSSLTSPSPPPLPPRASPPVVLSTSAPQPSTSWINFEEIPERRKPPTRITTVPLRSSADGGLVGSEKRSPSYKGTVVYCYVSPEECICECHIHKAQASKSHATENKSNRGTNEQLNNELDSNCELMRRSRFTSKLTETQGDNETSETNKTNECKYCECGRHANIEDDIENKPLLEYNSDGENDDSSSRREGESELTVPGRKHEADGQSLLSDSSFEGPSQAAANGLEGDRADMRPFEADFDIKSNRSSLASQDEQLSSEEFSTGHPP